MPATQIRQAAVIRIQMSENWRLPASELRELDETVKSPSLSVSLITTPSVHSVQAQISSVRPIQGAVTIYLTCFQRLRTPRIDKHPTCNISCSMQQVDTVHSVMLTDIYVRLYRAAEPLTSVFCSFLFEKPFDCSYDLSNRILWIPHRLFCVHFSVPKSATPV